jgi:PAS domain S-box-containing protein
MLAEKNGSADRWARMPGWVGYAVTVFLEVALTVGLAALDRVFPLGKFPVPYVLLTMIVAYLFGSGPAIVAGVTGWFAFTWLFVPNAAGVRLVPDTLEGWARETAFFLGVSVVAIAAIQTKKNQLRIQRLADETMSLNTSLNAEMVERTHAEEALRSSESKYRAIFDNANDAIFIHDIETGAILDANQRMTEIYGSTADEARRGGVEVLSSGEPPYTRNEALSRIDSAVSGKPQHFEWKVKHKAGETFWAEVILKRVPIGREDRLLAVVRDISERKQAEEAIHQLNAELEDRVARRTAELEASNKDLESFSYSVSHDLRAPLRAIDGFSNTLLKSYRDSLDERGQDYLQRVRNAAQRMGKLIDDILGLSRAGRAEMRLQRVDISAIARDILNDLWKSEPERKVHIVVEQGVKANADAHLIRIALDNLLGNAWKFTGNRDEVRIEVGSSVQNGEQVYFVRDNGSGFDPAYADKLFSPFQRLHTESEFPGTGIGLALVQRILKRHGGRIWAESAVDAGATFYFTLGEVGV